MKYVIAVKRPVVRCIVTGEDVISGEICQERSLRYSKLMRSSLLAVPGTTLRALRITTLQLRKRQESGKERLTMYLQLSWSFFTEKFMPSLIVKEVSKFSLSTIEPLHTSSMEDSCW